MYQLSTDYAEPFRGLCEGHVAVGFVNYRLGLALQNAGCLMLRRSNEEVKRRHRRPLERWVRPRTEHKE